MNEAVEFFLRVEGGRGDTQHRPGRKPLLGDNQQAMLVEADAVGPVTALGDERCQFPPGA